MEITSLTNAKVKQWVKYHEKKYRDQDQVFLIEGEHLIKEAHRFQLIQYIIKLKDYETNTYDYDVYEVTSEIMKKIAQSVSGSKVMALCKMMDHQEQLKDSVIMLDDVQDPGNLGMIIRSAVAFGYHDIILSNKSVDLYNDKVIRSTQGALFQMNVIKTNLHEEIIKRQQEGYYVYGTALKNANGLKDTKKMKKHILVFGHEGKGISKEILALCDGYIFVEMANFESLNVAAAASICMYEMSLKDA